jgi:hypothetical protein
MSSFVEIVIPNLREVPRLVEETTSWGGRTESYDPPRYRFGAILFEMASVPEQIATRLPDVLRTLTQCIRVPEALVLGWRYGNWNDAERESVEDLCRILSACSIPWAVVVDTSSGTEVTVVQDANDVCEQVANALRVGNGVTVVAHAHGETADPSRDDLRRADPSRDDLPKSER